MNFSLSGLIHTGSNAGWGAIHERDVWPAMDMAYRIATKGLVGVAKNPAMGSVVPMLPHKLFWHVDEARLIGTKGVQMVNTLTKSINNEATLQRHIFEMGCAMLCAERTNKLSTSQLLVEVTGKKQTMLVEGRKLTGYVIYRDGNLGPLVHAEVYLREESEETTRLFQYLGTKMRLLANKRTTQDTLKRFDAMFHPLLLWSALGESNFGYRKADGINLIHKDL